jgi:hypothetical protein
MEWKIVIGQYFDPELTLLEFITEKEIVSKQ